MQSEPNGLTPAQNNSMAALQAQARWFSGYLMRQAQRIVTTATNDR